MIELEREYTFLVEKLPDDLDKFPSKIIEDNYLPKEAKHPLIRIRRNGEKLVITKKYPVDSADGGAHGDSSHMVEHTIELTREEYDALNSYDGKRFKKRRFAYKIDGYDAEVDVYLGKLAGLVVVDFEFDSDEAMHNFKKPDFAGADITQEIITAGGMLCGKSYLDIAKPLREKYNYEPVKQVEKYEEVE
jgi:CYTH domain-containing protein